MPVKFPLAERRARRIGGAKLLLAVADPVASGPMKRALQAQGYGVLECDDGEQALAAARHEAFEVLLLDQNLGAIDGIELCRKLRRARVRAPILLFASANDPNMVARAYDAGADHVMPPPIAMPEVLARVRALRRRQDVADGVLRAGDLTLDVSRHAATRAGHVIELSAKEFQLLQFLLRRQGVVVSRKEILDAVWRRERGYESNMVDIYIHYLRDKIERSGSAPLIHTIRGAGYMLKASRSAAL